jgi:hypothetical protein
MPWFLGKPNFQHQGVFSQATINTARKENAEAGNLA